MVVTESPVTIQAIKSIISTLLDKQANPDFLSGLSEVILKFGKLLSVAEIVK